MTATRGRPRINLDLDELRRLRGQGLSFRQIARTLGIAPSTALHLWRGDHVAIKQLAEDFARYIYLPRLMEPSVLLQAVRDGVSLLTWQQDAFAYADSWDEAASRYRGLRGGQQGSVILDAHSVLVKPDVAAKQIEADERRAKEVGAVEVREIEAKPGETLEITQPVEKEAARHRRFHGSVTVDPTRLARDAGLIAQEVVQHLSGLLGANVEVVLEIRAEIPDGAPEHVVRTVTENCRTLHFTTHGFEES